MSSNRLPGESIPYSCSCRSKHYELQDYTSFSERKLLVSKFLSLTDFRRCVLENIVNVVHGFTEAEREGRPVWVTGDEY